MESDNPHKFRISGDEIKKFENLHYVATDTNANILKYLISNKECLLNSIMNEFGKPEHFTRYTSYDSLEKKNLLGYVNLNSLYDPYKKTTDDIVSRYEGDHSVNKKNIDYSCSITFSPEKNEKKIIPLTYNIGDLTLNLIYINPDKFCCPQKFVENDFDIDICRQTFDGKKITLYAIKNLIHKKFKYNLDHIINNKNICKNNRERKYVCFRKRIEKYKARGFECIDELPTIKKVKDILNIEKYPVDKKVLKKIANQMVCNERIEKMHEYIDKYC